MCLCLPFFKAVYILFLWKKIYKKSRYIIYYMNILGLDAYHNCGLPFISRTAESGTSFPSSFSRFAQRFLYSSSLGTITTALRWKPSKGRILRRWAFGYTFVCCHRSCRGSRIKIHHYFDTGATQGRKRGTNLIDKVEKKKTEPTFQPLSLFFCFWKITANIC